jgi:hypothetical protein
MMNYDDELDRAIFALPLEPLPEGLRASILAAVSVVPVPFFSLLEVGGLGVILALASWLCIMVFTGGDGVRVAFGVTGAGLVRFASDPTTVLWLALGASTAVWLSLVSLPARRRVAREGAGG